MPFNEREESRLSAFFACNFNLSAVVIGVLALPLSLFEIKKKPSGLLACRLLIDTGGLWNWLIVPKAHRLVILVFVRERRNPIRIEHINDHVGFEVRGRDIRDNRVFELHDD